MYQIIAAILLNIALLSSNVAYAADEAAAGECKAICSLPLDSTGSE